MNGSKAQSTKHEQHRSESNGEATHKNQKTKQQVARGINDQVMQKAQWDLSPHVGQKMFIKVVDKSTAGWGHITVDDFQFDGKVLDESPEFKPGAETKPRETRNAPADLDHPNLSQDCARSSVES